MLRILIVLVATCTMAYGQKPARIAQKDLLGTWTLHAQADTLAGPMVPMRCTLWASKEGKLIANTYYRADGEAEQVYGGDLQVSYNAKTQILDLAAGDRNYRFFKAVYLQGRLTLVRLAGEDAGQKGEPYFVKETVGE